jgi:hypothetical protein
MEQIILTIENIQYGILGLGAVLGKGLLGGGIKAAGKGLLGGLFKKGGIKNLLGGLFKKKTGGSLLGNIGRGLFGGGRAGSTVSALSGLVGSKARKQAEKEARAGYQDALGSFKDMEFTNPYADMTNTFSDLRNEMGNLEVSTEAADFQAQQAQQGAAQALDAFRGAGGGTGVAGLAQALVQEQRRTMQGIAADIARQETENTRLAAQGAQQLGLQRATAGMDIQRLGAAGEAARQAAEADKRGDILGIAAGELASAREARIQAAQNVAGGLGGIFGKNDANN